MTTSSPKELKQGDSVYVTVLKTLGYGGVGKLVEIKSKSWTVEVEGKRFKVAPKNVQPVEVLL